jgi:hypothetical protein
VDEREEMMEDRYLYSSDGLWCDRTKPWDETNPDFDAKYLEGDGPWYEEVDPGEVMNDQDATITKLEQQLAAAQQRIAALEEVAKYYITPSFREPVGMDGRCHLCSALRVSRTMPPVWHTAECAWWIVAQPLRDTALAALTPDGEEEK